MFQIVLNFIPSQKKTHRQKSSEPKLKTDMIPCFTKQKLGLLRSIFNFQRLWNRSMGFAWNRGLTFLSRLGAFLGSQSYRNLFMKGKQSWDVNPLKFQRIQRKVKVTPTQKIKHVSQKRGRKRTQKEIP